MNYPKLRSLILLLGLSLLSACSQKEREQVRNTTKANYQEMQLSITADAQSEGFSSTQPNSEAKAIVFDLGTKGSLTNPKFKDFSEGTKILCIIRSSNSAQPINYIQTTWTRDGDRFYIKQADGHYPFQYVPGQSLGTLYMMLVAGGDWDNVNKRLSFTNRIAPVTTIDGKETATLDVPFFSAWEELSVDDDTPNALKVKLKNYQKGVAPEPAFTLKPQGMLLRMRVENEMFISDGSTRDISLSKLYVHSTAYAGDGYYDLSENEVRAGVTKTAKTRNEQLLPWHFNDAGSFKSTTFTLASALQVPYDDTRVSYGDRGMFHFPNSPHLLAWVKSTDQDASLVGQRQGNEYAVRTEILGEVSDVRSNTVYSNTPGVDQEEANGKIVVPSMRALPIYASRKLAGTGATNAAFVNGAAYNLTLNLQRPPTILDRLSEYELADDFATFTDDSYSNVAYVKKQDLPLFPTTVKPIPILNSGNWDYPDFELLATIFGISTGASNNVYKINFSDNRALFPSIGIGAGNYIPYKTSIRAGLGYSYQNDNGSIVAYSLTFYPQNGNNANHTARFTTVIKYEYAGLTSNGVPRMKMTQRYLGAYSLEAVHFANRSSDNNVYYNQMREDLTYIINQGNSFWQDPLKSQDDIVRYFPMLGYKDDDGVLHEHDDLGNRVGYLTLGYQNSRGVEGYGSATFTGTYLLHQPFGHTPFWQKNYQMPMKLIRPKLK